MTNREDLYQQAWRAYLGTSGPMSQAAFRVPGDGIRAAVDLVLDAQSERPDWEVLREAAAIFTAHDRNVAANDCKHLAKGLEAEHRAAQEDAAAEAEREKLIEQAARIIFGSDSTADLDWDDPALGKMRDEYVGNARALADAGLLSAPTTDGGAA